MKESAFRRHRLLIVDDDSAIVRLLKAYLEQELGDRLSIEATDQPLDAERRVSEGSWDLVLLDIQMPGCDGMELLRLARRANSWVRVIFVTGQSTWDRIAEAIECGAADYLLKPVDCHQLTSVIGQECDRLTRWSLALRESLHRRSEPAEYRDFRRATI